MCLNLRGSGSYLTVFTGVCGSDFGELSRVAGASPPFVQQAAKEAGKAGNWDVIEFLLSRLP